MPASRIPFSWSLFKSASNTLERYSAMSNQLIKLQQSLIDIRHSLQFANDSPNAGINDTLWMMHSPETIFDAFDSALENLATIISPDEDLPTEAIIVVEYGVDGLVAMSATVAAQILCVLDAMDKGDYDDAEYALFACIDPSSSKIDAVASMQKQLKEPTEYILQRATQGNGHVK